MDTNGPQDSQYHEYAAPNVVPIASRPRPVSTFLDALRTTGLPESIIDEIRSALSAIGLTDTSLNEARQEIDRQSRRGLKWSRENPGKVAGGAGAIVIAFGLLLLMTRKRR